MIELPLIATVWKGKTRVSHRWLRFFSDLFTNPRPCDLCCPLAEKWPIHQNGVIDWVLRGPSGEMILLICRTCAKFISQRGLEKRHPLVALTMLQDTGTIEKVDIDELRQHSTWKVIFDKLPNELQISQEVQAGTSVTENSMEHFNNDVESTKDKLRQNVLSNAFSYAMLNGLHHLIPSMNEAMELNFLGKSILTPEQEEKLVLETIEHAETALESARPGENTKITCPLSNELLAAVDAYMTFVRGREDGDSGDAEKVRR